MSQQQTPILDHETKYNGALFPIAKADRKENGPVMQGNITLKRAEKEGDKDETVYMSAFARKAKPKAGETEGKDYYSVAIGSADLGHIYGAMFPVANKRSPEAPDYFGTINIDKNHTLSLSGWKRESTKDNVTTRRISIALSPVTSAQAEQETPPAEPDVPAEAGN